MSDAELMRNESESAKNEVFGLRERQSSDGGLNEPVLNSYRFLGDGQREALPPYTSLNESYKTVLSEFRQVVSRKRSGSDCCSRLRWSSLSSFLGGIIKY